MALGRLIAGGTVAGLGLVGVGYNGLAGEDHTTRAETGAIVEEGEIGAFRIRVGDCLAATADGEFESTQGIPCDQPHTDEVYYAFNLPEGDGSWPGDSAVGEQADQGCYDAFAPFVGVGYDVSIYGYGTVSPTEASWDGLDDREVLCLINNYDGTQKTGSAKGTAQ
ncbi:MAG: septum formation family protein [Acidimicrobiales bacterium]